MKVASVNARNWSLVSYVWRPVQVFRTVSHEFLDNEISTGQKWTGFERAGIESLTSSRSVTMGKFLEPLQI